MPQYLPRLCGFAPITYLSFISSAHSIVCPLSPFLPSHSPCFKKQHWLRVCLFLLNGQQLNVRKYNNASKKTDIRTVHVCCGTFPSSLPVFPSPSIFLSPSISLSPYSSLIPSPTTQYHYTLENQVLEQARIRTLSLAAEAQARERREQQEAEELRRREAAAAEQAKATSSAPFCSAT